MSQTFETLTKLKEDKDAAYKAFEKTEIWKAIFDHIKDSKNCILVEVAEGSRICCFRGTGYSIHVESILPMLTIRDNDSLDNYIRCDISATFYPDENTNSEDTGHFTLEIPDTLVSEFNKDSFDAWTLEVKKSRDERLHANEIYTLKRLMKKYPQIAGLSPSSGKE